ncbi:hypothetical protein [Alteromonas sp. a30]|uniref:hypothetical protein n=1 Tax=Alteromonas sp. a30 TaxID=2730917 RepID=UPI00227DCFBD|nr:hypothetical protein [Alteromonas sp. a30]MCY7297530.1 hypothetical protein [Alteromonas sp. a30]
MEFDKATIGLLGVIIGSLLTVILTTLKEWWFQQRKRREEQVYLAIQISCLLDRFVAGCWAAVNDDGTIHGLEYRDESGCLSTQADTPHFEPLSIDVSWKSLPTNLMYEILDLPNKVEEANAYIEEVWEHAASPPDYEELFEARVQKYSTLGLNAMSLAEQLRSLAKLPEKEFTEWNSKERLQERHSKIQAVIDERYERQYKTHLKMAESLKQTEGREKPDSPYIIPRCAKDTTSSPTMM